MKLTYRRCGDYYLPNIGIPAEDMRPLGKYSRMRMRYLREHRSLLFNQRLLSGKRKYEYELRQYRQADAALRRWQDDGEKIDCKGWKAALEYLDKERFMLDYQLEDMKEEVRRLEVVKREFIRENKQMKPERYAR